MSRISLDGDKGEDENLEIVLDSDEDEDCTPLEDDDPKELARKALLARRKSSHLLQRLEGEGEEEGWWEDLPPILESGKEIPPWLLAKVKNAQIRDGRSSLTSSDAPKTSPSLDIHEVRKIRKQRKTKPAPVEGLAGITLSTPIKPIAERLIKSDATLTRLDLCWRALGKKELKTLLSALLKNHTLVELDLAGNDLKKSGGTALGKLIKTTKTLQSLVLRNTELGKDGVKALCKPLMTNTTLRCLDLAWNNMLASGMESLEKALSKNKTLVSLDVQSNDLKRKGADAIARLITNNRTLTHLDVSNNDLTNPGAKEVFLALKKNETLLYLNISYNDKGLPIAKAGIKAINELLSKNRERRGFPDAKEIIMHTPPMERRRDRPLSTAVSSPIVGMSSASSLGQLQPSASAQSLSSVGPSSSSSSIAASTAAVSTSASTSNVPSATSSTTPTSPATNSNSPISSRRGFSLGVLRGGDSASMSDFHITFNPSAVVLGKVEKTMPLVEEKNPKKSGGEPQTWSQLAKLNEKVGTSE